jgi:hypothetical protein
MNHLASANRDRLVNALRTAPNSAAACWPCLPEEHAASLSMRVIGGWTDKALDAYAAALPVTRDRHARILAMLIQRAKPYDLAASSLRCRHRPLPSHLRRSQAAPKRHHLRCTRGPQRIRLRKRQQSQRDRMMTSQIDA